MTRLFRQVVLLVSFPVLAFMFSSRAEAATYDVLCTGGSCLTSGWEMYGNDPSHASGYGFLAVAFCSASDCGTRGGEVYYLDGLNPLIYCVGSDCYGQGYTETTANIPATLIDTATCLTGGCLTEGIVFTRAAPATHTPRHINYWGLSFDFTSGELTCRGSDCGANGWDIFSGPNLVATADCLGTGCFSTGYQINTFAVAVPLPASLPALAAALTALGFIRRRRRG